MSVQVTKALSPKKAPPKPPQLAVVPKVIRGDTYMVMADAAIEPEDEFTNLYYTANSAGGLALKPPFDPRTLRRLVQHNNILAQCVEAMSVNIDGTGHEFLGKEEGEDAPEAEVAIAKSFFAEPFPGLSFPSLRRQLRDDIEAIGYGFLEVLPNINNDIVGLRNHEVMNTRLVKYDDPVQVTRTIERNGEPVQMQFWARERRYVQMLNGKNTIYFREFGASRNLNRDTGDWESATNPVPVEKRATELLFFGVNKDANSPYFLPRWANQMPSVVGSRKAEENNLEFFDSGGMPPAIIFVQGGSMVGNASDQLRQYLAPTNKRKSQAVVVELQSNSGTIEAGGSVSAKVERFGSAQANDSMFSAYDQAAEEHVRMAFRLPPLFLGKAADYNFATAQTAYMVAEAQVFQPERQEFDEIINRTVIPRLGLKDIRFSSMPITLKSATDQIAAITLAKDSITGEDLIIELNKVSGLTMEFDQASADKAEEMRQATLNAISGKSPNGDNPDDEGNAGNLNNGKSGGKPTPGDKEPTKPSKGSQAANDDKISKLAKKFAFMTGRAVFKYELTAGEQVSVVDAVDALKGDDLVLFNTHLANYSVAHHHH